ncbi:MAG: hypothetical protein GX358_09360 [candidate division WS1 bacterium]|nr:hypothetical protein [candidate division WS1 bacterium]
MRAGFYTTYITPPLDYEMPGGFHKRFATGVHDQLRASAVYLENPDTALALVAVDCVSFDARVASRAREVVQKHLGMTSQQVLISATHTHSGGPTAEVLMSEADSAYCDWVARQAATAVICAQNRAVEARMSGGSGAVPGIGFNRRWHLADGTVRTNPGQVPQKDLICPAGPVDDELIVLGLWDTQDNLLGTIINFTCHTTFMSGSAYSADYPGALEQALGVPTVFFNGAMGDINQIDFTDPDNRSSYSGPDAVARVSARLSEAARTVLASATRDASPSLATASQMVQMPLRGPDKTELDAATELYEQDGEWTQERIYARELVLLDEMLRRDGDIAGCEIHAMRLGGVQLCAAPLQPFCQLGLDVKSQQDMPTMLPALANGCLGYLGPRQAYEEGGYELTLKRTSYLAPGSGGLYATAALETLERL